MKFTLEIDIPDSVNELEDEEAIRDFLKEWGSNRAWTIAIMRENGPFDKLYEFNDHPDVKITIGIS